MWSGLTILYWQEQSMYYMMALTDYNVIKMLLVNLQVMQSISLCNFNKTELK